MILSIGTADDLIPLKGARWLHRCWLDRAQGANRGGA
jgi:hypothetical protein